MERQAVAATGAGSPLAGAGAKASTQGSWLPDSALALLGPCCHIMGLRPWPWLRPGALVWLAKGTVLEVHYAQEFRNLRRTYWFLTHWCSHCALGVPWGPVGQLGGEGDQMHGF